MPPTSPHARDNSLDARVMQTWVASCVRCHGQIGAGDGPDGPKFLARNLSDELWQQAASDARIAEAIRKGKGTMPPFALDAEMVEGLVALVRRMAARSGPMPSGAPVMEGSSLH
jgi:mono/diheme cytochrome c family protein